MVMKTINFIEPKEYSTRMFYQEDAYGLVTKALYQISNLYQYKNSMDNPYWGIFVKYCVSQFRLEQTYFNNVSDAINFYNKI